MSPLAESAPLGVEERGSVTRSATTDSRDELRKASSRRASASLAVLLAVANLFVWGGLVPASLAQVVGS